MSAITTNNTNYYINYRQHKNKVIGTAAGVVAGSALGGVTGALGGAAAGFLIGNAIDNKKFKKAYEAQMQSQDALGRAQVNMTSSAQENAKLSRQIDKYRDIVAQEASTTYSYLCRKASDEDIEKCGNIVQGLSENLGKLQVNDDALYEEGSKNVDKLLEELRELKDKYSF